MENKEKQTKPVTIELSLREQGNNIFSQRFIFDNEAKLQTFLKDIVKTANNF